MTVLFKVGNQTITSEEVIPLLASYQLLPQLCREIIIDQAIVEVDCTPEEEKKAYVQFCERNQLTNETALQNWLKQQGITVEQLQHLAVRKLKLEKFKQATWSNQLESYFLKRKSDLDRVVYSLIRTQDAGIAQELYFRIQDQETSFSELAREFSKGAEAQTGGLIGPTEINTPHPKIAQMLSASKPGQLWPPTRVGEWFVIVRLEKFLPAQLDEPMQQRLTNELFRNWLNQQVQEALAAANAVQSAPQELDKPTNEEVSQSVTQEEQMEKSEVGS